MHEYEIRILREDKSTATIVEAVHLNDHAAIRAAERMAKDAHFEVWRDLDCVYGAGHTQSPPAAQERSWHTAANLLRSSSPAPTAGNWGTSSGKSPQAWIEAAGLSDACSASKAISIATPGAVIPATH